MSAARPPAVAGRAPARPDPVAEIRMTALTTLRGASYWSRRPVTRLDLVAGAYDEISSADVDGVTELLLDALPGLVEHRCSVGVRGGFVTRLRTGTYAPHVAEHVALELQSMVGYDVGFGRARGGDLPGEYTVVFEHRHAGVGLRAAALALDLVQQVFAGSRPDVAHMLAELGEAAAEPDLPPPSRAVPCAVTGGSHRAALRAELVRRGVAESGHVMEVAPSYLLQAGLPYGRAGCAVVLDLAPRDVPRAYQERDRAERLMGVMVDGVVPGGLVVAPAAARDIRLDARDAGCRVGIFSADGAPRLREREEAHAAAWLENGRVWHEDRDGATDLGPPADDAPVVAQLAALLTTRMLPDRRLEAVGEEEAIDAAAD